MLTQTLNPSSRNSRIFLLLIMALFIAPVLAAWLLVGQWRPTDRVNQGELLIPAQPIPHLRVQQPDGNELDKTYLHGRWTLIYMNGAPDCDPRCREGLYRMRQVHLALGKDMRRVQRLLMMTEIPDAALRAWLHKGHADMSMGVVDGPSRDFFGQAFAGAADPAGWIYLVDPLGNLLMRYGMEGDPKGMLEDLTRLLKLSKIG